MLKKKIIQNIINAEGGFVDNAADSGGPTNYGITKKVAQLAGYWGKMQDMPVSFAFDIYADKYWHSVKGDELLRSSEAVAAEVVDTAVNAGPPRAGKILQRSLNVLNNRGTLYDDIKSDGIIGSKTLTALSAYLRIRKEDALVKMLNVLQGAFYVELAERREKDETFIYGWFNNRVKL